MDEQRFVKLNKDNGIAIITIDNGPMNVLSEKVIFQLGEICDIIAQDPDIVVVIVTGAGERAFMAGADIKEFSLFMDLSEEEMLARQLRKLAALNRLANLNRPTIAAINGLALGGGCEVAMLCDIRIAEEQVLLGQPEIKLGLLPGMGGTQRLPRLVGESRAKELMYLGEPIAATTAQEIGLVSKVVPKGQALEAAKKLAQAISQKSLPALQLIKEAVNRGMQLSLAEGIKLEAELFTSVFRTEDIREGVAAFLEKRPARFNNR
jgi:Enoyl-CoA hydratase/carnithine racemase